MRAGREWRLRWQHSVAAIDRNGRPTAKTCVIAEISAPHGPLDAGVLGGLVDVEHDLIRTRTAEGRERAKSRGVKFVRKRTLTSHQQKEARKRLEAGETQHSG